MPYKDPETRRAKQRGYDAKKRKKRRDSSEYPIWRAKENIRQQEWNAQRRKASIGRLKPDVCDACGGNEGGIVHDHCHLRGHSRGWLCSSCNLALGMIKDSQPRLLKLAAYIERNQNSNSDQFALPGV